MTLLGFLYYVVVWGVALYVLWWAIAKIDLPDPFAKIATVLLVVLTLVVVFNVLFSLGGSPIFNMPMPARWR